MSKANQYESDLLALLFNGTAIANIADNTATSPLTQLFVSLHVADPADTGNQGTSEIAYTGYARVADTYDFYSVRYVFASNFSMIRFDISFSFVLLISEL
jgi:hypothetical protein